MIDPATDLVAGCLAAAVHGFDRARCFRRIKHVVVSASRAGTICIITLATLSYLTDHAVLTD